VNQTHRSFATRSFLFVANSAVLQGLLPSSVSVAFGIMTAVGWWQETSEGILSFKSTSEKPTNIVK